MFIFEDARETSFYYKGYFIKVKILFTNIDKNSST